MGLLTPRNEPPVPEPIPEPSGVHAEAARTLRQSSIPFSEVLYVLPDAIWYRDASGIRTAWMRWTGTQLLIITEPGTPAEPSASVLRRLDASTPST